MKCLKGLESSVPQMENFRTTWKRFNSTATSVIFSYTKGKEMEVEFTMSIKC